MVQEAQRIYDTLFDRPIPAIVAERFGLASERLEADVTPAELAAYRHAVAAGGDLEALELAGRYTRRLPLLTRKFRLMAFLAETLPENQDLFISHRDNLVAAFLQIGALGLRTAWLMIKGLILLARTPRTGGPR